MKRWAEFEAEAPEMAAAAKQLFHQFGIGLGFLATVRADGGPRLHPMCPILAAGGLWTFIGPSPKLGDLRRDGRYALHSFPPVEVDDEFYVTGRAVEITDPDAIATVRAAYHAPIQSDDETLFELHLERALWAKYEKRPSWPPAYTRWHAHSGRHGS
jgi:hypothetical protein